MAFRKNSEDPWGRNDEAGGQSGENGSGRHGTVKKARPAESGRL